MKVALELYLERKQPKSPHYIKKIKGQLHCL